jgi:hypothetical protein
MIRSSLLVLSIGVILSGCTYRGAVYSEYTHFGLSIRSSVESAAPIDVEFGYGRGVFTIVPKRDGKKAPGESASLISMNHLGSIARPAKPDDTVLRVNAGFVSGSAALAAVMPDGTFVVIQPHAEGLLPPIKVSGTPEERLKEAFKPTARFVIPEHQILQGLIDKIDTRNDAEAVYAKAGQVVSDEFTALFQKKTARELSNRTAFIAAKNEYVENQPDPKGRWRQLISALEAAIKEVK